MVEKNKSIEDLSKEARKLKQLICNFQDEVYPAHNKHIVELKETMTFVSLLGRVKGIFEVIDGCLDSVNSDDRRYFLQRCPKCNDYTFHSRNGKTTAYCVICNKRNKIEE